MKKNLISVIILTLVFANFVLTALLVFTILPETKKANELIESVCSAIDLELNSGAGSSASNIPIDQQEEYQLNAGETMTMNLKTGEDGKSHYAVIAISLSMDRESEGYEKYGPDGLAAKETVIMNDINVIVRNYTKEEFDSDIQAVQEDILRDLQDMFGADFIIAVNFSNVTAE